MPRKQKKYHYIYKTTNSLTDKFYIGMHSTDDLSDGYIGSGKRLWYSINKHGKDNHICEILEFCSDRATLSIRESEIVNDVLINEDLCMNIVTGGNGGFEHCNSKEGIENRRWTFEKWTRLGREAFADKLKHDPEFRERIGKQLKKLSIMGVKAYMKKYPEGVWKGKSHSEESKRKMCKSKIGHGSGDTNSQYGTCWIYHLELKTNKKINKEDLNSYITHGWIKGRIMSF